MRDFAWQSLDAAIGRRIKTQRIKLGFTQIQMAEKLDMKQTTYSDWETGNKNAPDHLYLVAKVLDCTVHDLLPRTKAEGVEEFGE